MTDQALAIGSPRFADARVAALARSAGVVRAWADLFARHGSGAAAEVSGDFAIALRDAAGSVFMAVDRFAVRTLCYRVVDGELRFAARADALAGPNPELDCQALLEYLYFHAIPSPRTIFKGVLRVPPGHCAVFEQGRLSVAPYWVASFTEASGASFDALAEEFRSLLRDAVASRLDGGKPACFLSGGTDSSTIAGLIGQVADRPAATYSIGFEAEGYDEMAYARIAARHFNTEHHEYYVTPADLVRSIPEVAAHYDQPFGNSSSLPAYHCARMARADGVGTLLAGDGGDELFGGNTRYAKQRVFEWYAGVPPALRRGLLEPFLGLPGVASVPVLRKAASYVEQASVPLPARLQSYNLLLRLGLSNVLTERFLGGVEAGAIERDQQQVWSQARAHGAVNRMLAYDWRYTLAENDLPKVCGTTGLAGIEVGFPFLDDRLLDFSLKLPEAYKLRGLKLRWFFKEALRGFLPDEILTKKKQGFGLPFGVWATRDDGLKLLAADSLRSFATRGVVRPEFIDTLLNQKLAEHPAYYGEMVWILMMLEQWLQCHAPKFSL